MAKSPVNELGIGAIILEYVISSTFWDRSKKVIFPPVKSFTTIFEPWIVIFCGKEPSSEAGYEIGSYFIPLLINYGDIINNVENYSLQTILGVDYDFRKTLDGGYVNQAVSILRYHNFGYLKLD